MGTNINMDMFDIIFFRTGVIILYAASLLDTPKRIMPAFANKITLGLLGLALMNIFIHTFAPQVLANTMNLFLAVIAFYIVYNHYDDKKDLSKFIILAGIINFFLFLSQVCGFDPVFNQDPLYNLGGGFLGNHARLGTYFALITAFMPVWLLPISIIVMALTKQYIILIPIFLILFLKSKLKYRIILTLMSLVLSAILWKHIFLSLVITRFTEVWKPALIQFFYCPFVGWGLGNKVIPNLDAIFNDYLQFIIGVGILGLVWLGYAFYLIRKNISFNKFTIPLIALLLVMLVEYPIEIARLWYLIIAVFVMALVKGDKSPVIL